MKSSAVVRMPVSGVLVGVVAALSLVGCSPKPAAEEPVRAVKLVTVGSSQATAVLEYSGEVRARMAWSSSQSNQSGYTRLLADVAGIVTAVDAEPGQVVSAGTPVVRIAQDGERDVVFAVPEDKRSLVRIGQSVQVRPWTDGEALLQGKVREVAASADPVTRTYTVKVALAGGNVPPLGATVHVLPEGMGPAGLDVIKLPTAAVREQGGQSAVWVYDPQTKAVTSRKVTVATADGNDAVIAEGLTPGMQVVAAGVHVLSEGQQVTVYQDKYAPRPAAAQSAAPATAAAPAKADGKPAAAAQ